MNKKLIEPNLFVEAREIWTSQLRRFLRYLLGSRTCPAYAVQTDATMIQR